MSNPVWMQITNWRETGRQVKVGPLDGRLMIFVVLLMLFPGIILLILTLSAMGFFYVLEYMGYTLPNAYRKLSTLISGKKRNGVHYWRQHKFRF
jgi:hypothetical protein